MTNKTSVTTLQSGIAVVIASFSLLVVFIGAFQLVQKAIYQGNLDGFLIRILILAIGFSFATIVGLIGKQELRSLTVLFIARIYTILYLVLTCFTYFGIALSLNQGNYSVQSYIAYIAVIIAELGAVRILQLQTSNSDARPLSLLLMAMNLFQLILIIFKYVFTVQNLSILHLGGELALFIFMSLYSCLMFSRYNLNFS